MRRIALTVTALFAAASAGCQTVNPSALSALGRSADGAAPGPSGAFSYFGGRAAQSYARPPAAVHPAVVAALDDLRVGSVRQLNEGAAIIYEGTTADDRKASVTLRPHPAGSRLTARIGLFGDEPLSRALMDRVSVRLGTLPPSAVPADPPSSPSSNPWFSRSAVPDSVMFKDQADASFRGTGMP